jgi:nitroimidazol reductase NimA-like FMN-containing flavoprotein (pyridoxamine 5'-phosphate oxidase superfamily)
MDRALKAKEIISAIEYITIATASTAGEPWNTPVTAAFDEQYNFYWTSMAQTQHSKNIRENPRVHVVIFDSTVPQGSGGAVYMKGSAKELSDPADIALAAALVYRRKNKEPRPIEEFMNESPRRLYKITAEKFWVNLDEDVKADPVNAKKEISLV